MIPITINSHLKYAHMIWQSLVCPGDQVIDATLGNGHDTLILAKMLQGSGHLIGYDIQEQALHTTQEILQNHLSENEKKICIELRKECHSKIEGSHPKLIVYNLGYLPGANKLLTTQISTTLESIKKAQTLIIEGGMISITLYPGHEEGYKEQELLLPYVSSLSRKEWNVCWTSWPNRIKAPSLLLIQKNLILQPS